MDDVDEDQELVLEDRTREQVLDWRNRAAADHEVVHDHIERYGEHSAQRLFTRMFVAQGAAPVQPRAPGPRLHHLGAGMSEVSGVDLARVALRSAIGALVTERT
ncbi:hypothetical protein ACIBBE_32740 [Streptomyces sp. NPDC051644]|uniref:hypothetical protein n=1 Tax=Streptomyces sp. NPDC051644 TaxID=3365666 RepID=UPI0037BE1AD5